MTQPTIVIPKHAQPERAQPVNELALLPTHTPKAVTLAARQHGRAAAKWCALGAVTLSLGMMTQPTQAATAPAWFVLSSAAHQLPQETIQGVSVAAPQGTVAMTMQQAMAHPDWLGRQPEQFFWGLDSQHIYFQRKQAGNELRDWFAQPIAVQASADNASVSSTAASAHALNLAQWDDIGSADQIINASASHAAWIFEGNIMVRELATGHIQQLTRTAGAKFDLQFMQDGRLSFRQDWDFYALDVKTGAVELLTRLVTQDAPKAPQTPDGYLAQEQAKLIQFIAQEQQNAKDAYQQRQQLARDNNAVLPAPIYVGEGKQIVHASLSPKADYLVIAIGNETQWNDKTDIMPNYITDNGDIAAQPVRRRVSDQQPEPEQLFLVKRSDGSKTMLDYSSLPGFEDDVLADVKAENAKRQGKTYKSEKKLRDITLLPTQKPIIWRQDGQQVALMLRAWDNKDRWLVTVDLARGKLQPQHRLHDKAWVNYDFNEFGWIGTSDALYYLSEESGFSQLYRKPLKGKAEALTRGSFEVSEPVLSRDSQHIYYRANASHPGIYNVYRVALSDQSVQQLTDLTGNLQFSLSPDEKHIALQYSTSVLPPELYVMPNQAKAPITRLTYTVSKELTQMALVAPKVVAIPSSHTKAPIYAKLYLPKDYQQGQKRRAVIFNHGAGYLQNSDLGWSNYFREFFFHTLLTQKGYVVLDMDYRASKGYGRDWRTAIYRQMGTPETQDLMDGVAWLGQYANVDVNRVGTYGGSYGGFMTFMAMFTKPDLFKAGSALRPVGDWAYYNYDYTSNILNTPDVDPIAYRRSSPIYFTEGLKGQLLINAPMVDDNVFFQDSVRVVQRLIEHEINSFETAIFPVEPHGFRQPSSWLDEYRRIEKLFDRYL